MDFIEIIFLILFFGIIFLFMFLATFYLIKKSNQELLYYLDKYKMIDGKIVEFDAENLKILK